MDPSKPDDNSARSARRARGQRLQAFAASLGLGPVTQSMREEGAAPIGPLSRALYQLIIACELDGQRALVQDALACSNPSEERCFLRLLARLTRAGNIEMLRNTLGRRPSQQPEPGLQETAQDLRARLSSISQSLEAWSIHQGDRAARQLETAAAKVEEAMFYLGLAERSFRISEEDLLSTARFPPEVLESAVESPEGLLADLLLGAERAPFDETPRLLADFNKSKAEDFSHDHKGPFLLGVVTPSRDNPLLYTRGKHASMSQKAAAFLVEVRETGSELRLGKDESCDLLIPVAELADHHASLFERGGQWWVVDQGDGQGIAIGGQNILPGEETVLNEGEMMRLGNDVQVRLIGLQRLRAILEYLERYEGE